MKRAPITTITDDFVDTVHRHSYDNVDSSLDIVNKCRELQPHDAHQQKNA